MNKGVNTIPSPGRHARKLRFVSVVVAGMVAGPLLQSANASPVVTLTVTPLSVPAGQNAVLSWSSTGAATCSASDAWTGARQTSGHALTAPTTPGSYVYSLSCTTNGVQVTATATAALTVTKNGFSSTELVSNLSGTGARTVDASLEDPWGIVVPANQPAAVANRESNTSTAYDGSGERQRVDPASAALVVHLPAAAGGAPFNPTGVAPANGAFTVTASGKSGAASLVYAGEGGELAAFSPAVDPVNAVKVYAATDGAVYRGLAFTFDAGVLYATDFHNGKIDVFNSAFVKQPRSATSYPFHDPALPAGYAPFGIAVSGSAVYVTYAKRIAPANRDPMSGAGLGLVDVFGLNGNFVKRLVTPGGALNAPYGIAMAPGANLAPAADLDVFSSKLFVANTGDGRIHAFDPATGAFVGTVNESNGAALAIPALHGIAFGNRYANQPVVSLFFTAGASNGAAGGYGRIDFGAKPRLHAPPTGSMSVTLQPCFFWLACGAPHYTAIAIATVASPVGTAKVDFFRLGQVQTSIAAPYVARFYVPLCRVCSAAVSATVTDVDGNIATFR